jgi:hypothetical protein
MPYYRIRRPLQEHEGAKTGTTYTCTRGTLIEAPEGEFKALSRADYSRVGNHSGPADTDSSDTDSSSSDTDQ